MRCLILFVFSFFSFGLRSQVKPQITEGRSENIKKENNLYRGYRLKGTIIDQTYFSLPTFKLYNEFLFGNAYDVKSVTLGLGYNNYSYDEETKALGFSISGHYTTYFGLKSNSAITFGLHYAKSAIDDYLKVKKSYSNFTFFEYEKIKYYKKRYAFSIDYIKVVPIWRKLFLEFNAGTGILFMKTDTPEHVVQKTYVNGVFRKKEVGTPSFNLGIKLGYEIY